MEAVSMQNLYNSKGKINWFGWIIFIGTIALIFFNLYQVYLNLQGMKKREQDQANKLKELEMNLKALRGNQYITLNNNNNQTNNP